MVVRTGELGESMHLPNGVMYKADVIKASEEAALVDWLDSLA